MGDRLVDQEPEAESQITDQDHEHAEAVSSVPQISPESTIIDCSSSPVKLVPLA